MSFSGLRGRHLLIWLLRQRVVHRFTLTKTQKEFFFVFFLKTVNFEGVNTKNNITPYEGLLVLTMPLRINISVYLYALFCCFVLVVLSWQGLSFTENLRDLPEACRALHAPLLYAFMESL